MEFNRQEIDSQSSISRRESQDDDDSDLLIILVVLFIVLTVVSAFAAIFANYVNDILFVTFWGFIIVLGLSILLLAVGLIRGFRTRGWNLAGMGGYTVALAIACGIFVYWIYDPPNAPPDLDETYFLLSQVEVGADGWTNEAFEIILDHGSSTWFIALQGLGTVPFVISMAIVLYLQLSLIWNLYKGQAARYKSFLLYSAPALAVASSLLLRVFG